MAEPDPTRKHEDEGEPRPWERPGQVRRDVEPHRGPWLLLLAWVGLLFSALSLLAGLLGLSTNYTLAAVSAVVLPVWLSGLALGAVTWALARQDLRAMRAGARDPAGKKAARLALVAGVLSVLLSVANCLVGLLFSLCQVLALCM